LSPSLYTPKDCVFTWRVYDHRPLATRESLMPFASHALEVAGGSGVAENGRRRLLALIAWSLALAFVVSAASSLWCYYRYAPADAAGRPS
jgi:hypothetical protein